MTDHSRDEGGATDASRVKAIKSYNTQVEAELAKMALDAEDIPSAVVGVSVGMEGGMGGVQLLVLDEQVDRALEILGNA
jgi:putative signal transducing protein